MGARKPSLMSRALFYGLAAQSITGAGGLGNLFALETYVRNAELVWRYPLRPAPVRAVTCFHADGCLNASDRNRRDHCHIFFDSLGHVAFASRGESRQSLSHRRRE